MRMYEYKQLLMNIFFYLQSGLTPLALAASKNHNDIIKYLVSEANADLTIVDQVTAIIIATYVASYIL